MKIGAKGIALIEASEGFRPQMYKDAVGLPTIGFGTLIDTKEEQYLLKATITREQAENLLRKDVKSIEEKINRVVQTALTQNQFDALVSFVYNLGFTNFRKSTLLKRINLNTYDPLIKDEFMKWVYAGGKKLDGLVTRRKEEAELYFKA